MSAHAQLWSPQDAQRHPRTFLTGIATGIAIHEFSHLAVATSRGLDVKWQGASITYVGELSPRDHLLAASAGFQGQWVASEYLLQRAEAADAPLSPFAAGIVCGHLLTTAAYLTFLKDHPNGDLTGIAAETDLSTDTLAAYVAVPALCDYWRLTGRNVPPWVPALSFSTKSIGIGLAWSFD